MIHLSFTDWWHSLCKVTAALLLRDEQKPAILRASLFLLLAATKVLAQTTPPPAPTPTTSASGANASAKPANVPTPAPAPQATVGAPAKASIEHLLPDQLDNWRAVSPVEALKSQPSAIEREYNVQGVWQRVYVNDHPGDSQQRQRVTVMATRFPSEAYGLFTFQRIASERTAAKMPAGFASGRYVVILNPETTGEAAAAPNLLAALREGARSLLSEAPNPLPSLPDRLPASQKIPASEVYVIGPAALGELKPFAFLKDHLPFTGGTEAISAAYQIVGNGQNGTGQMQLLLTEFHTPQQASDGYAAVEAQVAKLSAEQRAQMQLKRIGNYVALATNVQDEAAAKAILKEIKYEMKVYWEGEKFNQIPLEYRPPDSAALYEASQTAKVLLRTFYWIGVLLVGTIATGVLAGTCFFLWRRRQRRKLGLDDLFSDAGGNVRLNLDEYLLEQKNREAKLLKPENP